MGSGTPAQRYRVRTGAGPFVGYLPVVSGGQAQIDVMVTNYKAGMILHLLRANTPAGPWTTDGSATLQTIVANAHFRFTTSTSGAQQLFFG